jgi:tetratricopeptide (TPR) repeat protein
MALLRREIEVRRDVYGFHQLAWGLYQLGDLTAARAAADSALRMGTQDPVLRYHSGLIALAQGDTAVARRDLGLALSLNPAFHHRFADEAREALNALARS